MDGAILFFTIIISLIIGYSKGLNTKRKKINIENQELKEMTASLKSEITRLKSIKYDYEIETGAFVKKKRGRFQQDIILNLKLNHEIRKDYIILAAILYNSSLYCSDEKLTLKGLMTFVEDMKRDMDIIELKIDNINYSFETWNLEQSIKTIFLSNLNIQEYDITYREMFECIEEVIKETTEKRKKFAVHSHRTKK